MKWVLYRSFPSLVLAQTIDNIKIRPLVNNQDPEHKFEDELMMAAAWNSSNILQRVSLTITSVPNFLIESFKQKLASLLKVRIAISFSWK